MNRSDRKIPQQKNPAEEELLDAVGNELIPAGQYLFPHAANAEEMKSDEYRSKQSRCRGTLIVWY